MGGTFGSVWESLEQFGTLGTVWEPLEQFGNLWNSLEIFGTFWKLSFELVYREDRKGLCRADLRNVTT
jgi:hypothetical protein